MGCTQSEISPEEETPRRENRKNCTDLIWLIIYILFWVLMLIIAVAAFVYGNPQRIINGFDSFGNTCGVKKNDKLLQMPLAGISTIDKPYLLFMSVTELQRSLKICVKECPKERLENFNDIRNYYLKTGSNFCRYDIDLQKVTTSPGTHSTGPCPNVPVYESFPLLNRCFPKRVQDLTEKVLKDFYELLNSWDSVEQILSDLYSSWKEMVVCILIAFISSLIMVSILHLLATFVSWIFMIAVAVTSVLGTALLWYTWYDLKWGKKEGIFTLLSETFRNDKAFLWYSIIATIITLVLLLLVWVMRSRVSFLAALFKETAHCLGSIPGLFLQPIFTFIILVAFFAFWLLVAVCLATANYPGIPYESNFFVNANATPTPTVTNYGNSQGNRNVSLKTFTLEPIEFNPSWVKGMWWLWFICLIWTSEFILACQQMTIAGAVSHWYFRGPNASASPVLFSIHKLIKYHLGSVAKGSFLITIFKIPRLVMMYLHEKLKATSEKGSECASCGLKCCICCFYCLEKFIKFLNHNAYTIITIERVHFCKAAGIAFNTIVNNALQVATINSVGDFILFLGKCIVTAVTGSIGLLMLKRNDELHFFALPTLIICIFSFFIAHCILSLYEMVVDTLFICVCEDRNINVESGRWKDSPLAELGGGGEVRRDAVILARAQEMEPLPSKNDE